MSVKQKNNKILKRLQKSGIPINSKSEVPDEWLFSRDELLAALKTAPKPIPSKHGHVVDLNELNKFRFLV